jgi:hypothetical protein
MIGREVKQLLNSSFNPGIYEYTLDASSLASGIYLYELKNGSFSAIKKLTVVK